MRDLPDAAGLLNTLEPWMRSPRWWLGLSGGLDSRLLLDLLGEARGLAQCPPLTVIHVNHQLSVHSDDWARDCAEFCDQHNLELVVRTVDVNVGSRGLEAAARSARYRVFEELLGAEELLLLAHHLDDQVETFFLRLMRGAGTRGLSGMPASRELGRGALCRPLLAYSRSALEACARERGLRWVDDESNRDTGPDRNYLRHEVLPRLEQRWPSYRRSVASSMASLADAERDLVGLDAETLDQAIGTCAGEPVLALAGLEGAEPGRWQRLLRRWIEGLGFEAPGRDRLEEFRRQLETTGSDSRPELATPGYALRRYRGRVHLCPEYPSPVLPNPCEIRPGDVLEFPGLGRLEMRAQAEGGLRLPPSGHWHVRLRSGGERCRPLGRERSQTLKKLLQDSAVPPWQRSRLPLLYAGEELAAVADLWVCRGWECQGAGGYGLVWDASFGREPD